MGNFENQCSWKQNNVTVLVRNTLLWKQAAKKMLASLEQSNKMERKVILKHQCLQRQL